jgi:glycosyltransferase involved in cell wall biosynthesis
MELTYAGLLPPFEGGIAQHGANLTAAFTATGDQVHACSWRAPYPRRLYPGELIDPRSDPRPGVRYELSWAEPLSWWRIGRKARDGDALVLPWVTTVHAPATEVLIRAAAPTPTIGIVHNVIPHERHPFDAALTRRVLRRLHGAVVHARAVARDLTDLAPDVPIAVVPHPPNLSIDPSPLPPMPPLRVLVFGFVRAYKGVELALDAIALLRDRDVPVTMTIAGRFWEPVDRWRDELRTRGLGDVVTLEPGYVPDEAVGPLFARHHLVLAPYRSATQSGIVPLAYAAGRPVVSTNVGGLAEAVHEGRTGTLCDPTGPDLAAGVERVLDDLPQLAAGAGAATTTWRDVARAVTGLVEHAG